jgi:hypothetical protein
MRTVVRTGLLALLACMAAGCGDSTDPSRDDRDQLRGTVESIYDDMPTDGGAGLWLVGRSGAGGRAAGRGRAAAGAVDGEVSRRQHGGEGPPLRRPCSGHRGHRTSVTLSLAAPPAVVSRNS